MAVIHSGGDDDKTAHSQNAGGGAQGGGDAPVFVNSIGEYLRHLRTVGRAKNADQWVRIARSIMRLGGLWFLGFAVLYALLFVVAGSLFPQLYQAWLDLCYPIAEYVGGLTPRAERIMTQLTENGYPERADDALHGIAIARVLMVPVFFCVMAGVYLVNLSPMVFSCTPRTRIKIRLWVWFTVVLAIVIVSLLLGFVIYLWEYVLDEGFGEFKGYMRGIKELLHGYHRGNMAMMLELLAMGLIFLCAMFIPMFFAFQRSIRFVIVKHPPEDKS